MKPGEIVGVQATARSCIAQRLNKARQLPALRTWLAAGTRFQVWGWTKVRDRWRVKIVELLPGDVVGVQETPPRKPRRSRWQQAADLFSDAE